MTTFRVWAPRPAQVQVRIDGRLHPLTPAKRGWWTGDVPTGGPGTDYSFVLDGGEPRPDPRSAWQPHGVHGPSRVVDHAAFSWTDRLWRGTPLAGAVLYELHIGTFTADGTFDAAVRRLDHLVELGVTAVELLPCNAFDGERGWGYDGVGWYSVHSPYGGPDGLKRLVDACHARGLGVVMDVVYNHLGPVGNYLPEFGPYLTAEHRTPWGPALNLDRESSDEVRRFILDNATMWLRDYHIDGLRLDAVHSLVDARATPLLAELAVEVHALGAQLDKPLFVVAECDRNDPRLITSHEAGGVGLDGQWADDVHHSLHALLTGEQSGYYGDFGSLAGLAKVLRGGFLHDGTWSSFRGRTHGRPVPPTVPGHRFVAFLQNHDQVGNRATGDRLSATASDGLLRVGAALLLTSPFTPMLWMGEEWGARTPWQYFSDHDGELGEAVRSGRRAEFAEHGWATADVPGPQSEQTFLNSKLDWSEPAAERGAALLAWYRDLLALRRSRSELTDGRRDRMAIQFDEHARWISVRRGDVLLVCNLAHERQTVALPEAARRLLLASAPGVELSGPQCSADGETAAVLELEAPAGTDPAG